GNRDGQFDGRVGDYAGAGGYYGGRYDQYGWGGLFNAQPLTNDEIRQYRGEVRQQLSDLQQLRGLRNTPGIDPAQLDELMKMLRQLDDEKIYQNANELMRLNAAVAEAYKRFDFAFRRQT